MLRAATAADEPDLRRIAAVAKGHWGYDPVLVRRWASGLTFHGVPGRLTEIAILEQPAAMLSVDPGMTTAILEDLWVLPGYMGQGLGRLLFRRACELARARGCEAMEWVADPNSVPFYERMGGVFRRDSPPSEWGRILPVMGIAL